MTSVSTYHKYALGTPPMAQNGNISTSRTYTISWVADGKAGISGSSGSSGTSGTSGKAGTSGSSGSSGSSGTSGSSGSSGSSGTSGIGTSGSSGSSGTSGVSGASGTSGLSGSSGSSGSSGTSGSGASGSSGTSGTSPGGLSGGVNQYVAVWNSGTTLTTGTIQDDFGGRVAVNGNPGAIGGYALEVTGDIYATGNIIAFSDESVKDNVKTIENALDKVNNMRGVTFTRNDEEDKERVYAGVIAQEMEQAFPEVVFENPNGTKAVAYPNIVSVLIEAIKEQQIQIDELKRQIKNNNL